MHVPKANRRSFVKRVVGVKSLHSQLAGLYPSEVLGPVVLNRDASRLLLEPTRAAAVEEMAHPAAGGHGGVLALCPGILHWMNMARMGYGELR